MNERPEPKDWIVTLAIMLIMIGFVVAIQQNCSHNSYDKPTQTSVNTDSLIKSNDSIKQVIINLDSAKHYEMQKVSNLSNDSTVELFKQLVKE